MPCVSTQTTTFVPLFPRVLQNLALNKKWWKSMRRIHGLAVKRNEQFKVKFEREVLANKKIFFKIVKEMTLLIRLKQAQEARDKKAALRSEKIDARYERAAQKAAKKAREKQRKFDKEVNKFIVQVKKAAQKEQDKEKKKSQKKFDKEVNKFVAQVKESAQKELRKIK